MTKECGVPRGPCWLPELQKSLLFSTTRPFSTGEKLVFVQAPARVGLLRPFQVLSRSRGTTGQCPVRLFSAPCTPCFQSFPGDVGYAKISSVIRVNTGFTLSAVGRLALRQPGSCQRASFPIWAPAPPT